MQARLDRLGRTDRAALQAASVLGQRFLLPALQALTDEPAYDPRPLIDGGLLVREGAILMFAHALIQEATYASLLSETARRLHRRAADWLGDGEPELRAQHLDRAGDPGPPRPTDRGRATARGKPARRALENAERGLALARGTTTPSLWRCWPGGCISISARRARRGHISRPRLPRSRRCRPRRGRAGIAESLRITDDLPGATAALDRALAKAEAADLPALASRCHYLRGNLLFPLGRVEECMQEHRAALSLAERAQSPALVARALGGLADGSAPRDRCAPPSRHSNAASRRRAARRRVGGNRQPPDGGIAECYLMRLHEVREMAEVARVMARQAHNPRAELIALHGLMVAAMESGRPQDGLPHVDRARAIVAELGAWRFEAENVIFGAELQAQAGDAALAADMAHEALALCREHSMAYMGPAIFGMAAS